MQGEALAQNLSQYQLTGLLLLSELAGWCPDILFPHGLEASPEAALLEGTRPGRKALSIATNTSQSPSS